MNTPTTNQLRHALLLVGSAKKEHESTSEALGHYLLEQLAAQGFSSETIHVQRALRTPDRTSEFLALVDAADLFVLAFPVYVDSLPYLVTRAMEQIAEHRQSQPNPRRAGFLAIANCGFPEAQHCKTALDICAVFAQQAHFEWRGGLALGEGGMVAGRALAELGGSLKTVRQALEMTAAALAKNEHAPQQAIDLLAKPLIPFRLYTSVATVGWHLTSWQNGAHQQLYAQPLHRNFREDSRS